MTPIEYVKRGSAMRPFTDGRRTRTPDNGWEHVDGTWMNGLSCVHSEYGRVVGSPPLFAGEDEHGSVLGWRHVCTMGLKKPFYKTLYIYAGWASSGKLALKISESAGLDNWSDESDSSALHPYTIAPNGAYLDLATMGHPTHVNVHGLQVWGLGQIAELASLSMLMRGNTLAFYNSFGDDFWTVWDLYYGMVWWEDPDLIIPYGQVPDIEINMVHALEIWCRELGDIPTDVQSACAAYDALTLSSDYSYAARIGAPIESKCVLSWEGARHVYPSGDINFAWLRIMVHRHEWFESVASSFNSFYKFHDPSNPDNPSNLDKPNDNPWNPPVPPDDDDGGGGTGGIDIAANGYIAGQGIIVRVKRGWLDGVPVYEWQINISQAYVSSIISSLRFEQSVNIKANASFAGAITTVEMGIGSSSASSLGLVFHGTNSVDPSKKNASHSRQLKPAAKGRLNLSQQYRYSSAAALSSGKYITVTSATAPSTGYIKCEHWWQVAVNKPALRQEIERLMRQKYASMSISANQSMQSHGESLSASASGNALNITINVS